MRTTAEHRVAMCDTARAAMAAGRPAVRTRLRPVRQLHLTTAPGKRGRGRRPGRLPLRLLLRSWRGLLTCRTVQQAVRVLSQFTDAADRRAARLCPNSSYLPGVYPAGPARPRQRGPAAAVRRRQAAGADRRSAFKLPKTYLVQVEGEPDEASLDRLRQGVRLKDGPTRPAEVERIAEPAVAARPAGPLSARACPTAGSG